MKKNNILIVVFLFLSVVYLSSCSDFLDERPQSDFTQEGTGQEDLISKYKSLGDAESELLGAYNSFKNDIFQMENFLFNDVQSDNCYVGGDGANDGAVDNFTLSSINTKVSQIWDQYFSMIGSSTNVIENTKLMEASAIEDVDKKRIIAEAKFIRAWSLFDMVRFFGDLPMVLQLIPTITAENLETWYPVMYPERSPEEEVFAQIIEDLNEENTIKHLTSQNKGAFKATKGAAYGLLAKVEATKGAKNSRDYNKVVKYCNLVINEGYQLVENFDDLWNPDIKFTSESLFEVYYTTESPNWAYWVFLKEDDGSVTWRRYCTPTHELIAKFDKEKDVRYSSSIIWKEAPYDVHYPASRYPFSYKIREKSSNIILMRLADILLLKAEALVELGQPSEAIDIVNRIRERAGFDASYLSRDMSQDNARLAVEKERQLELYMEGQRWYDLLRNDRMLDIMRNHKDQDGKLLYPNLQEYRRILPIPQNEMDKNTRLTQNEGY